MRGRPQRVSARAVRALRAVGIRSRVEQRVHDGEVAAFGRRGQRALAAGFLIIGKRGITPQQFAHMLFVAEGGGDRDRVFGAGGQQPPRHRVVVPLPPIGVMPQRQRHRPKAVPAQTVVAAKAGRVHVRAAAQQQGRQFSVPRFHRVVQRAAPQRVRAIRKFPVVREEPLHGGDVATGGCVVNGVPRAAGAAFGELGAQQLGDRLVAAVARHVEQRLFAVAVERAVKDVRAVVDEQARGLQVAFAHGEVQRRRIPELRHRQRRVPAEQGAQLRKVAGASGGQHAPDVRAAPLARPVERVLLQLPRRRQFGYVHGQ